jgi:DHA1 family tetracycline resistance protein-like MFS transporter
MTATFGTFADDTGMYFPGAPYILAAGFSLIAILIAILTISRMKPLAEPA